MERLPACTVTLDREKSPPRAGLDPAMLSRSYRSPAREVMFTPTSIRASGRISEMVFTLNTLLSKVPIVSPYNGSLRVPSVGHIEPSGSSMRMLLRTQSIVLPSTEAGNSAGSRFAKASP